MAVLLDCEHSKSLATSQNGVEDCANSESPKHTYRMLSTKTYTADIINGGPDAGSTMPPSNTPTSRFPTKLESDVVWDGADLIDENTYVYTLSGQEKAEIGVALNCFKKFGLDGDEVNTTNFPLPTLRDKLFCFQHDLLSGKGFFVLRGLGPQDYSPEDNAIIFLGVSSYIGGKRGMQDREGNILVHLHATKMPVDIQEIGSQEPANCLYTNDPLAFHNDSFAPIVALHVRSLAAEGGKLLLASAGRVYNNLVSSRPDLLEVMTNSDWEFVPIDEGTGPARRPLFYYHDNHLILNCARAQILSLKRSSSRQSPLAQRQVEALKVLGATALQHALVLSQEPGDMIFVNNLAVMHAREPFIDDDAHTRHIVRLYLSNEEVGWKIPPALQPWWDLFFNHSKADERWELVPVPKLKLPWLYLSGGSK